MNNAFILLARQMEITMLAIMKFALAILVFLLFGVAIGGGILMLLHGSPWLLIIALLAFTGAFIKYGCQTH